MKAKMMTLLAAATVTLLGMTPTSEAETVEASASFGIYSNYVWRGQTLSEGWVAQPTVGLSSGGFGVNLWSNYDFDSEQLNETDFTVSYSNALDKFSYEAGYIYYGLDGAEDTQEFYLTLSYDVILAPSATLYWDIDEGDGGFLVLGSGYSYPLTETIAVDIAADITVNLENDIMGAGEDGEAFSGLYNADISVGSSIPISGAWSADLLLAYSFALTDDAKAAIAGASVDGEEDVFWGGLGVSLAF